MEKSEQQSKPAMMRDVWFVSPGGYDGAHFAVMPEEIARRCILAGCPEGGTVLDPFCGAGTVAVVADRHARNSVMIELNPEYVEITRNRLANDAGMFASVNMVPPEPTPNPNTRPRMDRDLIPGGAHS